MSTDPKRDAPAYKGKLNLPVVVILFLVAMVGSFVVEAREIPNSDWIGPGFFLPITAYLIGVMIKRTVRDIKKNGE